MAALAQAPEVAMFTFTCLLILACIPLRLLHLAEAEDFVAAIIMFLLPLKLLFFCRASRSLGSFIVMIYKILVNDVLCFVVFLIIFVAGFSQCEYPPSLFQRRTPPPSSLFKPLIQQTRTETAFLIIFKTHQTAASRSNSSELQHQPPAQVTDDKNYFVNLFDGVISMHMMALNEFSLVFDEFDSTSYPTLARLLFCVYMVLVSILLINMLIAMLGKTYQDISSQPNESLRQWARALLTVERTWSKSDRLKMLDRYSHRAGSGSAPAKTKCRYYSSTWALTQRDLDEINFVRNLTNENKLNAARLARSQSNVFADTDKIK